jgi:hypothetical protein
MAAAPFRPEPLQVTSGINPLLECDLRSVDVTDRWQALSALSATSELHQSGVGKALIATLFPDEFSTVAPALSGYFKEQRPVTKFDAEWWGYYSDAVERLNQQLSPQQQAARGKSLELTVASGAFGELMPQLKKKLGGTAGNASKRASMMLLSLWCMHWHMANLSRTQLPQQQVYARFALIFDWVLPTLPAAAA